MTRLSCHRFRSNEVCLWLSVIAYNLGNLWRRLVLPRRIDDWSLTNLQQRLVKTGGRQVKHARYYWLLLARAQRRGHVLPHAGEHESRPDMGPLAAHHARSPSCRVPPGAQREIRPEMASHEKMKIATEPFHPLCLMPVPACPLATQPPSTSDRTVISLISAIKDFPAQEEHDVAQLIVRNVDPEVVHRLKLRAAQHGRSMEAEHREILRQALLSSEPGVTLKALLLAMPPMGDDTDFARLPDQGREVEL